MPFPTGYTQANNGYLYESSTGAGPFSMDSAGVPMLVSSGKATSFSVNAGNTSAAVGISNVSAQGPVHTSTSVLVSPTVDCFVRQGANPTALSTGVDMFLFGGFTYRLQVIIGQRLALIGPGAGTAYITPEV